MHEQVGSVVVDWDDFWVLNVFPDDALEDVIRASVRHVVDQLNETKKIAEVDNIVPIPRVAVHQTARTYVGERYWLPFDDSPCCELYVVIRDGVDDGAFEAEFELIVLAHRCIDGTHAPATIRNV